MARANAAGGSARVGTLHSLALALAQPAHLRMAEVDRFIRQIMPLLVAVFLVMLVSGVALQISAARDRAVQNTTADLELIGTAAAIEVNAALARTGPSAQPADILANLPERLFAEGRRIALVESDGTIVAGSAPVAVGSSLAELLGPAQPLTVLNEKAGVLRLTLPDGTDVLATVRTLRPPMAQMAVIAPVSSALSDWWTAALRAELVLCATILVTLAIATAYLWQARRARAAEHHYGRVHDRIDTALNRGRCGLWDWDIARGRIYWSESMYAMLGLTPTTEVISFGEVNALVHPEDEDLWMLAEDLAARRREAIDHVLRLRHANGAWVWLRVRAELVHETGSSESYLVGIAVDITDEKRLAERSATADGRLSDAVEAIPESFALWDAESTLVTCNARYMGLHRFDAAIFPIDSCPPPLAPVAPPGWSPSHNRDAGAAQEVQLGDGRWLQISERRLKDGGLVSVGTDITALKTHEERLMDSERRLMATVADLRRSRQALELQAQQLAEMAERHLEKKAEAESASRAKSEFLAKMSHELRTPLNAIIGFSDLMCAETFGPLGSDKYAGYAADIRASGEDLLALITDVLEMSRLEAGRVRLCRSLFTVEDTVDAVLASVAAQVEAKGLRLVHRTSPGCVLHADRLAVEKVLQTLLVNACKFTADGGQIAVRAVTCNGGVNIFVADDGQGIAAEAMVRLGRPFEQIDPTLRNGMKGSGLGLAIARSMLELHGGTLRLRSRVGVGTVVLAHFPAPVEAAPARTLKGSWSKSREDSFSPRRTAAQK